MPDADADAEALHRLALWMLQRFAPIVAADPPNGIVIDSTGADHLHGGEAAMLATLVEKLDGVGLRARAAIADTWGAAHAFARFGARPGYVSAPGNAASDVAPLPIAALRLAPETGAEWPGHWPRPSRLLACPEPIDTVALLPDHPPVSFTWRGVRRRVKRADGPERIFGEWWKRDPELTTVRDYFRVEDDAGERYWVYRAGDGEDPLTGSQRWFLHGIFG